MERNALTQAQMSASRADSLVEQAVRISPRVRHVGRVNIPAGYICSLAFLVRAVVTHKFPCRSIISDVFFDNIFTDMAFHGKSKSSTIPPKRSNLMVFFLSDKIQNGAAQVSRANREVGYGPSDLAYFVGC
jgi:hypothetical protein